MRCRRDQTVGGIFMFPVPKRSLASDGFRDWQYLETFEGAIQPALWIRRRQFASFPLTNDLHAGNRADVTARRRSLNNSFDRFGQRQPAHELKPDGGIKEDAHYSISPRIGSSRSIPL